MISVLKKILWEAWLPLVVLVVWWFVSAGSTSFYFPPLEKVLSTFRELWLFDKFESQAWPSLQRLFLGFVIGCVLGLVVGIVLGVWRRLEKALSPIIEFFRSMPSVAIIPILVIIFGLGTSMKVATIAFVTFFPVLLNTIDGARSVDPVQRDVAHSYGMPWLARMRFIYLPAASPQAFAGARVALSLSVMAMAMSEMVGTPGGIGSFILDSQRTFDIPALWTGILAVGIVGYVLNKLFVVLENRVLSWHRGMTAHQK